MKETFKSMIYMARRFKLATALNILGLVLAYATFYILMTQISFQATFNQDVNDYKRLYRLECNYIFPELLSDNICRPFAEALNRVPEVESYSLVNSNKNTFTFKRINTNDTIIGKNDTISYDITNGNFTVVSTIAGKALDGCIEWNDSVQNGYIIPKSIAIDYFGTPQCAGDSMALLYFGEEYQVPVRGVYEDFPDNSAFRNIIYTNMGDLEQHTLNFSQKCYVKLKTIPKDLDALNQTIKQAIITEIGQDSILAKDKSVYDLEYEKRMIQNTQVKLTPIEKSYFEPTYTEGDRGYSSMYYFLFLGCIIVIIVGTINFLNCTLVESPIRIKSINTRLVLGATRSRLRKNLIFESVITSVATCLIAIALCTLLSLNPIREWLQLLLNGDISLLSNLPLVIAMLVTSIVLGIIAGWYPAKFATSFQPAIALKASFVLTPQGIRLRNTLVFIQLLVTMLMTTYIGIIYMQSRYIFNSDYGFNKDRTLMAELPPDIDDESINHLCQGLKALSGIEGVSLSNNLIASTDAQDFINADINGEPIRYRKINTDIDYLRIMGIQLITGRDFQENDSAVIIANENAMEQFNQLHIGTKISTGFGETNEDSATVIGVCKNFRYGTMRMKQTMPFLFIVDKKTPLNYLNIRLDSLANRDQLQRQAVDLIKKYCNMGVEDLTSLDNKLYDTYHYELFYFRQIYTISFICIALTLIGLLCLTMFETEYRRKEIGIRKVAGATTSEVVKMLCSHYVTLILISFVIAMPIAFVLGKMTLKIFADSTPIHWWIFPLALLLGGGITLGVVICQSWRAAHENPVNSIKTE